jgi:sporulation protein YlmC with PRC-barrel domain
MDRTYQVNVTQDRLQQAPSFENDQWPILTRPGWFDSTDKFFGTQPQRDTTRGSGGWGMQGRIQEHWNQGQQTTVSGTITNIDRQSPQKGVDEGLVITVQTADGEERLVHLGPAWYLEGQVAELQDGQQVQVQAREIAMEDRVVVLAQSVQFDRGTLALRDQQGRPVWDAMQRDQRILAAPEDRELDDRDDLTDPARPQQPGQRPGLQDDPHRPGMQPGQRPGLQDDPHRPGAQPGQQPGIQEPHRPGQPGIHDQPRPGIGAQPGMTQPGQQMFVRGSDMRGKNVRNWNQENIGTVNELAIDVNTGRVPFIIAGFGGFLGMGETEVVLPWQSLNFLVAEGMFMLAVDEQRLRTAPQLERDQLARLEDPTFRQEVYSHFGMDPAFATYEPHTMPGMDQRQAWGAEGQIQQQFRQGQEVQIRGTVSSVSRGEVMPGTAEAVVVVIRDQQGQEHTVKLGPAWFLQRQDLMVRAGEEIAIEGRKVQIDGREVVLAQSARTTQAGLWLRDEQGRPRWDALQGDRQLGIEEQPDDDHDDLRPSQPQNPGLQPGGQPDRPGQAPRGGR